ncbi:MAG: HAD family phosphatase, partial [Thermoguttaceae bacterium]|nr:HAD family phosphatase [Thermoguttaceae bacterium]
LLDMDGVLVYSNPAHFISWQQIAEEDNVVFTRDDFQKTFGMVSEEIVPLYWPKNWSKEKLNDVAIRKERRYLEMVPQHVKMVPGALEFIRLLAQHEIKMAVGSSGPRVNVEYMVDFTGIRPYLSAIVTGSDVALGKPAPDIFLEAARQLNVQPENCLVIDDSRSGVTAGHRGKMTVFGFFSEGHQPEEYELANLTVRSFDEIRRHIRITSPGFFDIIDQE